MHEAFRSMIIFGARGMLGHALAATFHDCHPVLLDKAEVDLTNHEAVRRVFREYRPSCVLNAAAYTNVDGAEDDEALALTVNASVVRTLAQLCEDTHSVMVHYSTDYVFDGRQKDGYNEASTPGPLNAYGRTKLRGEEYLLQSGADGLLIRTSWLYGPYGKNFVENILNRAQKEPQIEVVDDQFGKPTYTMDLAFRTSELLKKDARGIHHATNEGVTTWYGFAKEILRCIGVTTPVVPIPSIQLQRKAVRPKYSGLLNTKDRPMRFWQDALQEYLKVRD